MGTTWLLVKHDKKEWFELDKGLWSLDDLDWPTFQNAEQFAAELQDRMDYWQDMSADDWRKLAEYIWQWLGSDKFDVFHSDQMIDYLEDHHPGWTWDDNDNYGPYKLTGSRFDPFKTEAN